MGVFRCVNLTDKLISLQKKLNIEKGEVKALVGQWQESNNKDWDSYPTEKELRDFREQSLLKNTSTMNPSSTTKVISSTNTAKLADKVSSEGTTQQYGVIVDPNLKANSAEWQSNNPTGIVAYRVNFNRYNTPEEANAGRIGNPFSENARGKSTVEQFFTWLVTGENFGNTKATEEYRQAIINRILNTSTNDKILYYKELGRPSHATILGYLINHKELFNNSTQTQSKAKINIYAGTNENANLSNFAKRPFTLEEVHLTTPSGRIFSGDAVGFANDYITFNTVEGAFQAAKLEYLDNISYTLEELEKLKEKGEDEPSLKEKLSKATGYEAKKIGKSFKGLNIEAWDKDSSFIMKALLKESFKQNPEALQQLLDTGNAELTHTQDKGKWGKEFPKLLMEVREELKKESIEKELKGNLKQNDNPENFNSLEESESILSNEKTILSNEELKYWNEKGVGSMPRILTASERTDPAFHVQEILDILEGKKEVSQWGVDKKLSGKDFAGLYLVTKHDGLPMLRLLKTKIPKLIHFSITGLGGTIYEPGVMKYNDLLDRIEDYIKQGLEPDSITIRIDPIVPGVTKFEDIESIVSRASKIGIKRIRFSIMDAYANTVKALSTTGYDFEQYYGSYNGKINFNAKSEYIEEIVNLMLQLKDKYNVTLGSCAENIVRSGISKEGCLSVGMVNKMLGTSIEDKGTKNNTQRALCSCFGGKIDALAYNRTCASHCVYCYAKHENDKALEYYNEDGTLKDNIYTKTREEFSNLKKSISTEDSKNLNSIKDNLDTEKTGIEEATAILDYALTPDEQENFDEIQKEYELQTVYDAKTRKRRVQSIVSDFSEAINYLLDEKENNLKTLIENSNDENQKLLYIQQLKYLDRKSVVDEYTPKKIFEDIKYLYSQYAESSFGDNLNLEIEDYKSQNPQSNLTDKELREKFTPIIEYRMAEMAKVVKYFDLLVKEALPTIAFTENLSMDINSLTSNTFDNIDGDDFNNNDPNEDGTKDGESEAYKDGWQIKYKHISKRDSLTQRVKKMLYVIPRTDSKGNIEFDDIGNVVYLTPDIVLGNLLEGTKDVLSIDDFIPALRKMQKTKPWVSKIFDYLNANETFVSELYQNLRGDTLNYWIQSTSKDNNGNIIVSSKQVNADSGFMRLFSEWKSNYENGIKLDTDSLYDINGNINNQAVKNGLKWITSLKEKLNSDRTVEEQTKSFDYDSKYFKTLHKVLNMSGINISKDTLNRVIKDSNNKKNLLSDIISELTTLYNKIPNYKIGIKTEDNPDVKDLFSSFSGVYKNLAKILTNYNENLQELSFHENNKSYYSHVKSSYLLSMLKHLKNVMKDESRFKDYIERNFLKYEWFCKDDVVLNHWLDVLINDKEARNKLDHKVVLHRDRKEYTDWTPLDYTLVNLEEYDNIGNEGYAYYHVPILSDSPSAEYIQFKKYNNSQILYDDKGDTIDYKEFILNKMKYIVLQEYNRIMLVRQRDKENIKPITNYDIKGSKNGIGGAEFKFFPALNTFRTEDGTLFIDKLSELEGDELDAFIKSALSNIMEEGFQKSISKWRKLGLFDKEVHRRIVKGAEITEEKYKYLSKYKVEKDESNVISFLEEYYWNSKLATSQILQLTITDIAFFKDMKDLQKRYKAIHVPKSSLNTKATFDGKLIGREFERTIYLKDEVIKSNVYPILERVLEEKVQKGEITNADKSVILSSFEEVNVTDAQAYRSLSSYRAILGMSGQWNGAMENAFENLRNNNWSMEDFNMIWQTKKPFVFSSIDNNGIKTPIMHKNSEFLLLAIYNLISNELGKSAKLKAINDYMEANNIDVVQFESAVKIGLQGAIDLSDEAISKEMSETSLNEEQVIKNILDRETGIGEGHENPEVIHSFPYENYGIVTETPEHIIDVEQLVGSQIRKLILSDIPEDAVFSVNGKNLSKKELFTLYNEIIVANIEEEFEKLKKQFSNPKELEKLLQDEIKSNPRYGHELAIACKLDSRGKFNLPLYDPVQSMRVQQLLNSIVKSRITKQKIKGGALIQVSCFGKSKDLNIVFKNKDGEEISFEYFKKKFKSNDRGAYEQWAKEAYSKGELSVGYLECYMPCYSKELYPYLSTEGTHNLDINKLPENLRRLVGYRVPTEDKYSMIPLRIKGFLPQQNGSSIMLPAEITTLTGSDFDVDKLYVMLPEFTFAKYDMAKARKQFAKESKMTDIVFKTFGNDFDITEDENDFKEWFKLNKSKFKYDIPKIIKINYNPNKEAIKQSRTQRNNMMLDIIQSVLTNPTTVSKQLNPGNFDAPKKAARITDILRSIPHKILMQEFGIKNPYELIGKLKSKNIKELDKILDLYKEPIDSLSPLTQIEFHRQNMTSLKLIGIYANQNSNHALAQYTDLEFTTPVVLNNKSYTRLNSVEKKGKRISRSLSEFLASSVDNIKDPVLDALNQNIFTADISSMLLRLGYNALEVSLFMNQPIIRKITEEYFKDPYIDIYSIIDNYIKLAQKYAEDDTPYDKLHTIIQGEKFHENMLSVYLSPDVTKNKDYFKDGLKILVSFKDMVKKSKALTSFVQNTRADTQNGAAGPSIADNINKILRMGDFLNKASKKDYPLSGVFGIVTDTEITHQQIMESKIPLLQAFTQYGIVRTKELFENYFPYYNGVIVNLLKSLGEQTKTNVLNAKTINKVFNSLIEYYMSQSVFFGQEGSDNGLDLQGKRDYFLKQFPYDFMEIKVKYPELQEFDFIKNLTLQKQNYRNSIPSIIFSHVGSISSVMKENISSDWATLLQSDNPVFNKLALDLFRYCFYKNGLNFGPSSFGHLAPVIIRKAIPEYNYVLESLQDISTLGQFERQFILHNLNNQNLVPKLQNNEFTFTDSKNKVKDTFEIYLNDGNLNSELIKSMEFGIPTFLKYFSVDINGKTYYYELTKVNDVSARWERVEPLGKRNEYNEYSFDNTEINNPYADSNFDLEEQYSLETTESKENFNKEYKEAQEMRTQEIMKAVRDIYGINVDEHLTVDDNTLDNIEGNDRDDNGEIICK